MKTLIHKIILLSLVLLCTSVTFSQRQKIKKAGKDFDTYSYINARDIYLKVVESGYTSAQIYKNLGDTYYWNGDYENADMWYSKLITEFPDEVEVDYYYRASQAVKGSSGKEDMSKAKEYMDLYVANGGDPGIIRAAQTEILVYKATLDKASINTDYSDFGPSFYKDKLVFSSAASTEGEKIHDWNAQPFLDLFMADMDEDGNLSNVRALPGDINTPYHESSSTFTKDGKTVYFTRNNFIDGKKGKLKNKTLQLNLYRASMGADSLWGDVVELPFNGKDHSVAHPTLSTDEKRLYFSSDMEGTIGMSDIWYVDILEDNTYGTPVNLSSNINTSARESFPFISQDNNLYFSSDGRSGLGGYDVFMVALDASGIPSGEIQNLGEPINSPQDDFGFITNEEKKFGYVSSNRGAEAGSGSIGDDIYLVQNKCEIILKGVIVNAETGEVIPGATVSVLDSNNIQVDGVISNMDGSFVFSGLLDCDQQYIVRAKSDGCEFNEMLIRTPNETGDMNVVLPLTCDPCPPSDLGCRLALQPIYFDFDRFNIREDAAIELSKILAAMKEYPQLIIHIESHTDSRGNDEYNELLSDKRAQSTLNWLVDQGIDRERLTAKGYGEYQLVNECSNGIRCTEEEHQLNRRSMFIIQN